MKDGLHAKYVCYLKGYLSKGPSWNLSEVHQRNRRQSTLILTALSALKTSGNSSEQPQTGENHTISW